MNNIFDEIMNNSKCKWICGRKEGGIEVIIYKNQRSVTIFACCDVCYIHNSGWPNFYFNKIQSIDIYQKAEKTINDDIIDQLEEFLMEEKPRRHRCLA